MAKYESCRDIVVETVIMKGKYSTTGSDVGYSIPIYSKDGDFLFFLEVNEGVHKKFFKDKVKEKKKFNMKAVDYNELITLILSVFFIGLLVLGFYWLWSGLLN